MEAAFASGRVADLILCLLALETAGAAYLFRRRLDRFRRLIPVLASGAMLLLALRGALTGADWTWIAIALAGALVCHLADLRLRLAEEAGGAARTQGGARIRSGREAAS